MHVLPAACMFLWIHFYGRVYGFPRARAKGLSEKAFGPSFTCSDAGDGPSGDTHTRAPNSVRTSLLSIKEDEDNYVHRLSFLDFFADLVYGITKDTEDGEIFGLNDLAAQAARKEFPANELAARQGVQIARCIQRGCAKEGYECTIRSSNGVREKNTQTFKDDKIKMSIELGCPCRKENRTPKQKKPLSSVSPGLDEGNAVAERSSPEVIYPFEMYFFSYLNHFLTKIPLVFVCSCKFMMKKTSP